MYDSHPDSPTHHPLHPIPQGLPSTPGPSTCLMHPTWAGDLFHPINYLMNLNWGFFPEKALLAGIKNNLNDPIYIVGQTSD